MASGVDPMVTKRRRHVIESESDAGDEDVYEVDDDVDDEVMNVSFEELQERRRNKKAERQNRRSAESIHEMIDDRSAREALLRQIQEKKKPAEDMGKERVAAIMEAYKKKKIQLRNAFQNSVLDKIRQCDVQIEPLQDMALALDSASMIYGYRVDNAHLDMYDTRSAFQKVNRMRDGPEKAFEKLKKQHEKDAEVDEETEDGGVPAKKRKKVELIEGSRHVRMANLFDNFGENITEEDEEGCEAVESTAGTEEGAEKEKDQPEAAGEKDADEDGELDRDYALEDEEEEEGNIQDQAKLPELNCPWHPDDDLIQKLEEDLDYRREQLGSTKSDFKNPKIVLDVESLHLKRKEQRENVYYQMVNFKVHEKMNGSLFTANVLLDPTTHRLQLHPRGNPPPPAEEDYRKPYSQDFLSSIAGLTRWALQPSPKSIGLLLPKTALSTKTVAVSSNLGTIQEDAEYDMEVEEPAEDVITNQREEDDTILPDRTLLPTAMGNQTLAFQGKLPDKKTKRVTLKGLGESQMMIRDKLDAIRQMGLDVDPSTSMMLSSMLTEKVSSAAEVNGSIEFRDGIEAEEFNLSSADKDAEVLKKQAITPLAELGLGNLIDSFEKTWFARFVKVVVTREDESQQLRQARELSKGDKQVLKMLQKKVLKPGKYKMFVPPVSYPDNYPVDTEVSRRRLEELGVANDDEDALDLDLMDHVDDDFGFAAGAQNDSITEAEAAAAEALASMAKEREEDEKKRKALFASEHDDEGSPMKTIPIDERPEACILAAPEIQVQADAALMKLGKEDDAHWKFGKEEEKAKRGRKKKDENADLQKYSDMYFQPYEGETPVHKFKLLDQSKIPRLPPNKLFLPRKRRAQMKLPMFMYDVDNFVRPSLLFYGRYGTLRFDKRTEPINANKRKTMAEFVHMMANGATDEKYHEDRSILSFLRTFRCFHFERDEDADRSITSYDNNVLFSRDEEGEYGGDLGMDYVDEGEGGRDDDSFHSAMDDPTVMGDAMDYPETREAEDGVEMLNGIELPVMGARKNKHDSTREYRLEFADEEDEPIHGIDELHPENLDCDINILYEMLEIAKRAKQRRVDPLQVKVAMRGLLSNKYVDDRYLKRIEKKIAKKEKELGIGGQSEADEAGPSTPVRDTDTEPEDDGELEQAENEISRLLNAPPVDLDDTDVLEESSAADGDDGADEFNTSLRVSNFEIDGEHTFASMFSCLPHRLPPQDSNVHVATALVIALHMCNENNLICEQERPDDLDDVGSAHWMSNFVFKNADPRMRDVVPEDE